MTRLLLTLTFALPAAATAAAVAQVLREYRALTPARPPALRDPTSYYWWRSQLAAQRGDTDTATVYGILSATYAAERAPDGGGRVR